MNFRKLVLAFLLLSITNLSIASDTGIIEKYKQKIRPFVSKLIGEDLTTQFLGRANKSFEMPKIPIIDLDSKSTNTVDENKIGSAISDEELREKFDLKYIAELYLVVRGEDANRNELAKWINVLNQGGSREGVYRAIVLDQVYVGMENLDNPVNDSCINFTIRYMEKYLGMTSKKETFEGANIYRVKREIVKRTLDVIDALAISNVEDLYVWYALFSSEMAKDYTRLWQNKIRQSTDAETHYNWAKSVPFQHLKSEVIIKLHKILNSLD